MSIGFRKSDRRRRLLRWLTGIAGAIILACAIVGWRYWTRWAPHDDIYGDQGVAVSAKNGEISWQSVRALGADFAYITATDDTARRDPGFASNWNAARAAGLRYGAELRLDPCAPAGDQATLFITTVPRDNAALPPAIRLGIPDRCNDAPSRDRILSDLNTLINIVETHSGKPAILHITKAFEARYGLASHLNRTLWLDSNYFEPDYTDRPWVMWSTSDSRRIEGISGAVEWVVIAP